MKISKRQLKRIIREEKAKLISEAVEDEKTMVYIKYGDYGYNEAVVPLTWLSKHPDELDAKMISKNEALAKGVPVFHEGSHADAKHIEDFYWAANTLYTLFDEGYLDDGEILTSIFH